MKILVVGSPEDLVSSFFFFFFFLFGFVLFFRYKSDWKRLELRDNLSEVALLIHYFINILASRLA